MAVLDDVLIEEYERSKRMKAAMEKELSQLPQGYISKKFICNKYYFYIQKREGSKIISSYISPKDLPIFEKEIMKRKQLEMSLKEVNSNIKKIERVIK